jgi:tetratricopeptide (TPR) repeat protein
LAAATKLAVVVPAAVAAFLLRRRPVPFGLAVAASLAVSLWCGQAGSRVLLAERSFFGVLRVNYDAGLNAHQLVHGSTRHGVQSLDSQQRHEPWGYFHRQGPLGRVFQALQPRRPLSEIGVLGLGVGAIAAYGQPGERITYYEIDPAVERIARNPKYFTYLADCRASVEVILGDARLSLEHGPRRQFDLLVVDAFSSDAPPIHLITREALQIYWQRLTERGLLAFDISNRYLDLKPMLGNLAEDAGVVARVSRDVDVAGSGVAGKEASTWVVMARRAEDLGPLAEDPDWEPLRPGGGRLWTDDFSNVLGAVRWEGSWDWLLPARWRESEEAAHVAVGFILSQQGRVDEAIVYYRKALAVNPNYADAHNNLASALLEQEKLDEAIAHYREALEINPHYADAHNNLASALLQQGKLDEAFAHYQKALELDPKHAGVHFNLGNVLLQLGKLDEAIAHYQKGLQIKPRYDEGHNNLGAALYRQGKLAEAVAHYRSALEINPRYAKAHYNLGNALCQQGKADEAIPHYQKAVEIDPRYAAARHNLGGALYQQGKVDEAIAQYRDTLKINPDSAETHNTLATVLAASGRTDEAIEHYREALRLKPDSVTAQYNLANTLANAGSTAAAIEQYDQLLQRKPDFAAALQELAWLLATRDPAEGGDAARAVPLAQRARELAGQENARTLDTLAAAYAAAGRFDDAVLIAERAVGLAASARQTALAESICSRLELYRAGQPYRQPTPSAEQAKP